MAQKAPLQSVQVYGRKVSQGATAYLYCNTIIITSSFLCSTPQRKFDVL